MEGDLENQIESCTICLNDDISDKVIYKTNCSHIFCKECIEDWFKRGNDNCPLCRSIIEYYESEGEKYRLIIHNTHTFGNRDIETIHSLLISNARLKQFIFCSSVILFLLYNLFIEYTNLYNEEKLNYNQCMKNLTEISNNLDICNDRIEDYDNSGEYIKVIYNNIFRECYIPYNYLDQCF